MSATDTTSPLESSSPAPEPLRSIREQPPPASESLSSKDREWCALPKKPVRRICFKALCMIAISKPSVEHWEELRRNSIQSRLNPTQSRRNSTEEQWEKHKKLVINRFENMNVTAGLVLTSSAVFISTNPRNNPNSYTLCKLSYILEVISFVAALISLMTGTSVLIIYDTCYAHEDILGSFKKSRLRLVLCLVLMAFPSLALVGSTLALMTAVFIAGFVSDKLFVKVLTGVTCVIFFALAIGAIYVFSTPIINAVRSNDNAPDQGLPLFTRQTKSAQS